jgi:hypothetical protein
MAKGRAGHRPEQEVMMKLADLQLSVFARRGLSDTQVRHLTTLVENGVELDPIEVARGIKGVSNSQNTVVDGRHRIQVYRNLKVDRIKVVLLDHMTKAELLARALEANIGGALPPSNEDITYVIDQLLDAGETKTAIAQHLSYFPPSMARRVIMWAESNQQKRKVKAVLAEVAKGNISINQAAEKYGINAGVIKEAMGGKAKDVASAMMLSANVERIFRSASAQLRRTLQTTLDAHLDGNIADTECEAVLKQVKNAAHRMEMNLRGYFERLESQKAQHARALRPRIVKGTAYQQRMVVNA